MTYLTVGRYAGRVVRKQDVLDTAIRLTLDLGTVPSLARVAREVGLTKQGVLHYFPNRAALDDAVLLRALDRVDAEMTSAARHGRVAETYLRLAAPSGEDRAAALVLLTMLRSDGAGPLPAAVDEAVQAWEAMIADELGDPTRATVVRLVGDGLFSQALVTGAPPPAQLLDDLIAHLVTDEGRARA